MLGRRLVDFSETAVACGERWSVVRKKGAISAVAVKTHRCLCL